MVFYIEIIYGDIVAILLIALTLLFVFLVIIVAGLHHYCKSINTDFNMCKLLNIIIGFCITLTIRLCCFLFIAIVLKKALFYFVLVLVFRYYLLSRLKVVTL